MNEAARYEAYRRTQIEDGKIFQDFVVDVAWKAGLVIAQYSSRLYQLQVGESRNGIEIKHDKKMKQTGNVCIEVAEKARPRPGPYARSGIMREDHWLYVIGDYDRIFFFPSNLLRLLHRTRRYRTYETPTSQGFLIPVVDACKYSALTLQPNAEHIVSVKAQELERMAVELYEQANRGYVQLSLFDDA